MFKNEKRTTSVMMKKYLLSLFMLSAMTFTVQAQGQEPLQGIPYYLPKTAIRLSILVERTHYQPGRLVKYAEMYMKLQGLSLNETMQYRIVGTKFHTYGLPDSTKFYVAFMGKKHTIQDLQRDRNGVLIAVNATTKEPLEPQKYVSARKPILPNPKDYMNADILAATNSAKMAELIAKEIYEIRDSRNLLSRGQAEFMPKDGEQLKLMLHELQTQETALMQVFEGVTSKDTTEYVFTFVPTKQHQEELVFRFSKYLGVCDKDEQGGIPYYIRVEDLNLLTELPTTADDGKMKDYAGIHVNLPGKVRISLQQMNTPVENVEAYAGQFGRVVTLSGELFSKKQFTKMQLNPITGNIENVETTMLK